METVVELDEKTYRELLQSQRNQAELADQVLLLRAEIQWYREQLGLVKNRLYSPSSEQTPPGVPGQEYLIFNEAEALANPKAAEPDLVLGGDVAPAANAARKRKQSGQREMQLATLPVEEILYTLPEDARVCPQCTGALHTMGQDERREVKVVPAQFVLVVHKREKYACRHCERNDIETPILTAPMPSTAFPNSLASPTSVAYIMGRKFVEGMPLYRQEASLKRSGFEISRQTMANWMLTGAGWLESITARMRALLLARDILHADETRLQVLQEDGRKAQSQSFMWLYRTGRDGPPVVLYDYRTTRERAHPRQFLSDFRGYLHVDGYAGYEGLPGVALVGCWAHARRKFFEALNLVPVASRNDPKTQGSIASAGLDFCDRLFAVERDLCDIPADVRKLGREAKSKPILDAFSAWLEEKAHNVLPKSALGQAIKYCRNQWSKLTVFLEDGRLELDNNRSERSIKPFVIGRKNWLFSNTPRGARASATIYSIVETAKENGLDPFRYLTYLFEQLPNIATKNSDVLDQLLPWAQPVQAACTIPTR